MNVVHLDQKQLAARWRISEATLERWRSEGIGPGEKNGLERVKTGFFWQPGRTTKSAGIRENPRKHAGVL